MPTAESATLTITIDAPPQTVFDDLADPAAHPAWATEFFTGGARPAGDGEFAVTVPMLGGPARMKFDVNSGCGAIDIYLAPGEAPYGPPLPVRLVPNGDGVDVLWTLARAPGMPDAAWQAARESMQRELVTLKARHER